MPRGKPFVFLSLLFIFAAFFPSQYCAAGTDSRKVNRDSLYLFNDEMFVNNIPRDIDYPFYSDENNGFNVYQFNPQADHVYINNLKLKFSPLTTSETIPVTSRIIEKPYAILRYRMKLKLVF